MRTVARLLRTLRIAAGLSVDAAGVETAINVDRLRQLGSGLAALEYLEGMSVAKAYMLCPNCFAKHVRAAVARDRSDCRRQRRMTCSNFERPPLCH